MLLMHCARHALDGSLRTSSRLEGDLGGREGPHGTGRLHPCATNYLALLLYCKVTEA